MKHPRRHDVLDFLGRVESSQVGAAQKVISLTQIPGVRILRQDQRIIQEVANV